MSSASWAYDFTCYRTVDAIQAAFNATGPWQWQQRDSDIYGFYLNCRPLPHVHLRVYQSSQMRNSTRPEMEFNAWLEIGADGTATQPEIDAIFQRLLQSINATNITAT